MNGFSPPFIGVIVASASPRLRRRQRCQNGKIPSMMGLVFLILHAFNNFFSLGSVLDAFTFGDLKIVMIDVHSKCKTKF